MPHQCTSCGHVFADGSKEMLSGCPDCGGTKFQFHPDGADIPDEPPGDVEPPDPPAAEDSVGGAVGSAAATVRDLVGGSGPSGGSTTSGGSASPGGQTPSSTQSPSADTPDTRSEPSETDGQVAGVALDDGGADTEDAAQASARSDVVSRDELPDRPETEPSSPPEPTEDAQVVDEPNDTDRPDLSELRAELNDQFESIKVVEPGQYELNLMELYDREEYIIALEEDGRYSIQVPETWRE